MFWHEEPWACGHNDPIYRGAFSQECAICGDVRTDPEGPAPGSWADIACMMAADDDSGFDWDAWKDEMKERDL